MCKIQKCFKFKSVSNTKVYQIYMYIKLIKRITLTTKFNSKVNQIQKCIKYKSVSNPKVNQIQRNNKFKIYFKFQSVVNSKGKNSIVNVIQKCIKFKIVLD